MAKTVVRDLAIGKIAEDRVAKLLQEISCSKVEEVSKEKRIFWDLMFTIDGVIHAAEVKNDIYALRSGNIAIELYNPKLGKESGLTATRSDLWVFVVGEEVWATSTEMLRDYVAKNKPFRIIDSGGDNNALLYLYKKDALMPGLFKRIDDIDAASRKSVILAIYAEELDKCL